MFKRIALVILVVGVTAAHAEEIHRRAILISVDGLRSDALTLLSPEQLPNLNRLMQQGAFTLNARNDPDFTVTLPNHISMVTGYPVLGDEGHHYTENSMPTATIQEVRGKRVFSIFDVLKDNNRLSALCSSKLKFAVFEKSFPIDKVALADNDKATITNAIKIMTTMKPDFLFLHLAGPDKIGHKHGWQVTVGSSYMEQVKLVDDEIGQLWQALEKAELLNGMLIMVTTDHGGEGLTHVDALNPRDYTIPFIIWSKEVAPGVDLYTMNLKHRKDPLTNHVLFNAPVQPIRNGESANIILKYLGYGCVEGSTIGCQYPLIWQKDDNG